MTKDNTSEFKKMESLIKETKNDKLLYAFYNFYDKEVKSFREEIEKTSSDMAKAKRANEKSYLNSEKSLQEIHDLKIDVKSEKNQMHKEIEDLRINMYRDFQQEVDSRSREMMNQLRWKLNQMQYSMIAHPRLLGLMLLIRGSNMIYDLKKAKTPDIEFVKFQGRLDTISKNKRSSNHKITERSSE